MENTEVTENVGQQTAETGAQQVPSNVTVNHTGNSIQVNTNPVDMTQETEETSGTQQGATEDNAQTDNAETVQTAIDNQTKTEGDLKADLTAKGVDFDAVAKEFDTKGELSQETLDALDKAGYPKSVVDAYISGMQATAERFAGQVKGFAGGEQAYAQLIQFMNSQPVSTRESFNALIKAGNLGQIQLAINGIKAQMTAKYGTSNPTVMTGGSAQQVSTGFANTQEMVKAMSDPRYQTDPKYTREVILKVQNASFYRK